MLPTYRYYQIDGRIVSCTSCGELRIQALRRRLIEGKVYCMNCTSKRRTKARCGICGTVAVVEKHHICKRAYDDIFLICLNCHARISKMQTDNASIASNKLFAWLCILYTWMEVRAMQRYILKGVYKL